MGDNLNGPMFKFKFPEEFPGEGVLKFRIDRRITIVIFTFSAFDNPSMQISALRLLCCLLPAPNRDTLKVLLEFLAGVAQCAEDSIDEKGNEVSFATHR